MTAKRGESRGAAPQPDDQRLSEVRRWLERHPFNQWLGLRFDELGAGRSSVVLDVQDQHRYISGLLHGGLHATLLDTVMGVAARLAVPEAEAVRTTSLQVEYLAPSRSTRVHAWATVERVDLAVIVVAGWVTEDDSDVVSRGQGHFTRVARRPSRGHQGPSSAA